MAMTMKTRNRASVLGVTFLAAGGIMLSGCAAAGQVLYGSNCAMQKKGADVQVQLLHGGDCTHGPLREPSGTWTQASLAQPGEPGAATGRPLVVSCTLTQQGSTVIILDTAGSGLGRKYCREIEQHGWRLP